MLLAVDAVDTIGRFVNAAFLVFLLLISDPHHPVVVSAAPLQPVAQQRFAAFCYDVVEPYLRIFPSGSCRWLRLGGIGLDLSPIVGIIVLEIVRRRVVGGIIGSFG